jgi:hypothetical protein
MLQVFWEEKVLNLHFLDINQGKRGANGVFADKNNWKRNFFMAKICTVRKKDLPLPTEKKRD